MSQKSIWGRPIKGAKSPVKGITAGEIKQCKPNRSPKHRKIRIMLSKQKIRKDRQCVPFLRGAEKAKLQPRDSKKRIQWSIYRSKREPSRNKRRNDLKLGNKHHDNSRAMKRRDNRRDGRGGRNKRRG